MNVVLWVMSGILWMLIGIAVGMLVRDRRSPERRRAALEAGIVERRKASNDMVVMVSPAWRLFVRDQNGGATYAHVEDRNDALTNLVSRACEALAPQHHPRVARPPAVPRLPDVLALREKGFDA